VVAKTICENQTKSYGYNGTAAIGPGVRSPCVVYDPDGGVIDIGSGDMAGKVFNELYAADRSVHGSPKAPMLWVNTSKVTARPYCAC